MNTPASYASASLYVGDLHTDVTEAQLFEIFKQLGPVASIRVCRDAVTRRSLGYAYVNYHNVLDAERAIDLFNYKEVKGKPIRIMWSQRDPSVRRSNVGNIFIKNLHKDIDNKALYDTFSTFGAILSCKVATDEHANSRGYGFVHYETQEAADTAIEKVNGKLLNGKKCFVGSFVPRKERSALDEIDQKWTNIYVKYLDKSVDDDKLRIMFEKYGTVTSAVIMKDDKDESKGFGFVNFERNDDAQKAIDDLNDKELDGKKLYVGRAQKKTDREKELKDMFLKIQRERMSKYQGVNLYVKNLDETIDDEKLRQEFSVCGTITSAKVMSDEKGASKGFGFVCFSTPEEATKSVTEMNGKMIVNKPIYVALAQRKEQRRQQLEVQYSTRATGFRMQQTQVPPMYATGGPVFYPPRSGFVQPIYAQQMVPRPRFQGQPQGRVPGFQPIPGFIPPVQPQRGQQKSTRGGKGPQQRGGQVGPVPGYPGIKYNANVRNQQIPVIPQGIIPPPDIQTTNSAERKQMIGENLFPLIEAVLKGINQQDLAGKITGMLLESMDQPELMQLLDSPEALNKKITEALEVLEAHNATQKTNEVKPDGNATPTPVQ